MYIPKKAHTKSRRGCQGCKQRKIKCDESRPKCGYCEKRNLSCDYHHIPSKATTLKASHASSINSTVLVSSSNSTTNHYSPLSTLIASIYGQGIPRDILGGVGLSGMDAMLMHHYSQVTHLSLSVYRPFNSAMIQTWGVEIPRLAIEQDFLKNAVLGTTSLHLQSLVPQDVAFQCQSAMYQDKAFRGFREAVSNITPENTHAVLATSVLLLFLAMGQKAKDNEHSLWIMDWMGLHMGVTSLITALGWQVVQTSRVSPIFAIEYTPFKLHVMLPNIFHDLLDSIGDQDPDQPHVTVLSKATSSLGCLYARLSQNPSITWELNLEIIAWSSQMSVEFNSLVRQKRPRALIIVAYYLVFFSLMQSWWWAKGIAVGQIQAINNALSPEWRSWVSMPHRAIVLGCQEDTIALLLGQLEGVQVLEED